MSIIIIIIQLMIHAITIHFPPAPVVFYVNLRQSAVPMVLLLHLIQKKSDGE